MRAPLGKKEAEDERRRKMFFAVTFFPDSFFRRVRDAPKENSCGLRLFVLFLVKKVIHFGSVLDVHFDYLHSVHFRFEVCVKKELKSTTLFDEKIEMRA